MTKTILLCDDEAHILRAAEIKLTRAGYNVVIAYDGEEGWQKVCEHRPDLVITDCQMPRLNGIDLAARIHNDPTTSHILVIMLTGKGFELSHEELREKYNILSVINKPFSPRDLLSRAEKIMNGDLQPAVAESSSARFPATDSGILADASTVNA